MSKKYANKNSTPSQPITPDYEGLTPQEKVKNYLGTIQEKLTDDLDNQFILIPKTKMPYLKQKQKRQYSVRDLKKIKIQKEATQKKLQEINEKQKKYLMVRDKYIRSVSPLRPKSQLSNTDVQNLKKLKKEYMTFQKQLQEKTKAFQQKQSKIKNEEKQLFEKRRKQDCEKRKLRITKRLEEMQRKKNERYKRFEEQKHILAKLKSQKKIEDELRNRFQRQEQEQELMKRKRLQEMLKERSIDFNTLKEHERKYQEMRKRNKEDIERRRNEFSRISNNSSLRQKVPKSKYYTITIEEEKKNKEVMEAEKQLSKKKRIKMLEYSHKVHRQFAPPIKEPHMSQEDQQLVGETKQISRPTLEEAKMLGLHFLEMSKAKAKKKNLKKDTTISNPQQNRVHSKYPNYLNENRKEKEVEKQKTYKNEVNEVKKIMKLKNYSEKQKFERVKIMTEKIQQNGNSDNKSSSLVRKIAAKLQIIETIY